MKQKLHLPSVIFCVVSGILFAGCRSVVQPVDLPTKQVVSGICGYDYSPTTESQLTAAGWTKTFEDNFNTSPNTSQNTNWNVWVGGSFNNELQMYTDRPTNLTVTQDPDNPTNSLLVIKTIKEKVTGPKYRQDVDATPTNFDFTSARIESKTTFAPNTTNTQVRMVSRIKMPSGYGMLSAFWAYGDNWPTNGQIAILDGRGNEPHLFQTNYNYGSKPNQNLVQKADTYITSYTSLTDCWHVYELIWTKDALTFLLDGQVFDVKSGGYVPNLFGKLERVTLNQAVGGDLFFKDTPTLRADQIPLTNREGIMLVDWVRVYVKK